MFLLISSLLAAYSHAATFEVTLRSFHSLSGFDEYVDYSRVSAEIVGYTSNGKLKSVAMVPSWPVLEPPQSTTLDFTAQFDDDDADDEDGDSRYGKWLFYVHASKDNSTSVSAFEQIAVANKFLERSPALCGSNSGVTDLIDAWSGVDDVWFCTISLTLSNTNRWLISARI